MIRSVGVFILFASISLSAFSQDDTKKVTRINIPGSFMVDIGINRGISVPTNFEQGFWGSRTINLYYQYPIRIGGTKFSFVPGMGLGMERFKLTNNYTLNSKQSPDGNYDLIKADTTTLYPGTKKSMIVANYFDIPIEIRFDTRPEDISRSFNLAIGFRAGVLIDSFTKIKYKQNDQTKTLKDKQDHGLNDIRYGLYSRIGIGGFNWFFFYNSSSLFKTDRGPDKTTMNTFTAGISINGF